VGPGSRTERRLPNCATLARCDDRGTARVESPADAAVGGPGPVTDPAPGRRRPLVLAGIPRSGTTWTMRALAADPALVQVMEPDNEVRSAPAIWAKRSSGRYPVLLPRDRDDRLAALWSWVMDGAPQNRRIHATELLLRAVRPAENRRYYQAKRAPLMRLAGLVGAPPKHRPSTAPSGRRIFVKTVYMPLALEWLASVFDVDVLVLFRHPGNVLASWLSLDLNDRYVRLDQDPKIRSMVDRGELPAPGADAFERLVWQVGVLDLALERSLARQPTWVGRTHEQLCVQPINQFRQLYDELGLEWTPRAEEYLVSNDRPGVGFPTQRVSADQADLWKQRLTPAQIATMQQVLAQFPLTTWDQEEFVP